MEKTDTPVQSLNSGRAALTVPEDARWDDLRVAIILSEAESFRQAAERLGITVNTVRARLDRLEASVGVRLFRRSPKGVALTSAGQDLVAAARQVQKQVGSVHLRDDVPLISAGEIRLGVSEVLGVLWLAPRLGALQSRIGTHAVHLSCSYDHQRDRHFEVDIELTFKRSENPDMICARLATTHFMLFTSDRYIARHGRPDTLADLTKHRFIEQVAPGVNSHILDFLVGTDHAASFTPLRMNSGLALLSAVECGEGIAMMPTYCMALRRDLVPLDLPVQLRFDIYLSYAADLRNARPIVETVEWLRGIFTPVKQPWFADSFTHPRDMDFSHASDNDSGAIFAMLDNAIR
ncbi:LysR family transcriptional regulator [Sphingomonas abietis]|uniref:LysR family transcriptional regulator n=1 Tax=Sphingomonas abietis TaxID=3012344 RepID=A0ABY7NPU1_9SPHN|nr:LysR family transcriptional regulator [Sphingomonas abietis]WBO21501.1 LysR family transcriptional regulator [Sphingomonas abietis]